MASFSFIRADTPYVAILALFGLFGVVNSMQFTAMNSLTLIDLDGKHASGGNALLSVTMQISASSGVAIAAALLVSGFSQYMDGAGNGDPLLPGILTPAHCGQGTQTRAPHLKPCWQLWPL